LPEEIQFPEAPRQVTTPEILVCGPSGEASEILRAASSQAVCTVGRSLAENREFLWKTHGYINEYIRFADTKAGFCVGIASALIGALFGSKCQEMFIRIAPSQWTPLSWMSIAAFFLLTTSITAAVMAVRPRLWTHSPQGIIFWKAVGQFGSPEAFAAGFEAKTSEALNTTIAHHIYSLATVCDRKYTWLNMAIISATAGGASSVLVLLLKH
jgi:hypothetical protein